MSEQFRSFPEFGREPSEEAKKNFYDAIVFHNNGPRDKQNNRESTKLGPKNPILSGFHYASVLRTVSTHDHDSSNCATLAEHAILPDGRTVKFAAKYSIASPTSPFGLVVTRRYAYLDLVDSHDGHGIALYEPDSAIYKHQLYIPGDPDAAVALFPLASDPRLLLPTNEELTQMTEAIWEAHEM